MRVQLFHGSAHLTGFSPGLVSHEYAGTADLVPTADHPAGAGVLTCNQCQVVFDVRLRTDEERRIIKRLNARKTAKVMATILMVALVSSALAVAFAASHDELLNALKYGAWLQISISVAVLSFALLPIGLFVRVDRLALKARTKAGLHTVRLQKSA